MRLRVGIAALMAVAVLTPACGEPFELKVRLRNFIGALEQGPRKFTFELEQAGKKVVVQGSIDDSFRYSATLKVGKTRVASMVAADDSIALRLLAPALVLKGPDAAALSTQSKIVADALKQGRWVIDPQGAPPVLRGVDEPPQGSVQEAVEVFDYLRIAINTAANVNIFREDDIDPAYRPFEDHFPKPDENEGIRRYDLIRTGIPRPGPQGAAGGVAQPPRISDFRKMAIYTKGEAIVEVWEEIDVEGHEDFVEAKAKRKTRLLALLDQIKKRATGGETIVPRRMRLKLFGLGENVRIKLPANAVTAGLKEILIVLAKVGPQPPARIPPVLEPSLAPTKTPSGS